MSDDPRSDLDSYARLRARLAVVGADRARLLADHGFDEESWEALDEQWQLALSEQLEEAEGDDIPPLVLRYAQAFAASQRGGGGEVLELETFARCTRALERARDPQHALDRLGVTLSEYLRANQHWTPQLAGDPALRARFEKALRGK